MSKADKVEKFVESGKADKLAALVYNADADKEMALAAISGLEKLISNEQSLNALVGMMDNDDPEIRKAAVTALGSAEGSYVETRLKYFINSEMDPEVLQAAKDALAKVMGTV